MELSEFPMRGEIPDFSMTFLNFHDFIFSAHDFSMTFPDKIFSMTVGTLMGETGARSDR